MRNLAVSLMLVVSLTAPYAAHSQGQSGSQKNLPAPGAGLPINLSGSELGRVNEQYPAGNKFWGDDVVSRAVQNATENTADFLNKMWDKYGLKTLAEEPWHEHLRLAVEAGKANDWNTVVSQTTQALAGKANASDAMLLRATAYRKLMQPQMAQTDMNTLMSTRQRAQEFLQGNSSNAGSSVLNSYGAAGANR